LNLSMPGWSWKQDGDIFDGIIEDVRYACRVAAGGDSDSHCLSPIELPHLDRTWSNFKFKLNDLDTSDKEEEGPSGLHRDYCYELRRPPSVDEARKAYQDLCGMLRPSVQDSQMAGPVLRERLTHMKNFLWLYTDIRSTNPLGGQWAKAADQTARNAGKTKGVYLSRALRSWSKAYILDRKSIPLQMPHQTVSRIDDESLTAELKLHLQSLGKWIRAQDVVDYLFIPENLARLQFTKPISLRTAQRWMERLGYRWKKEPTGQYSDGHKRDDVVRY